MAVKSFIRDDTAGFPPAIGQIKEIAKSIRIRNREDEKMAEQQKRLADPQRRELPKMKAKEKKFMEKMRLMLKEI